MQLSTLFREVQELGFAGSYQTLTRQVRSGTLRRHCEACAGAKGRATTESSHPPGGGDPARLARAARGAVGRDGPAAGRGTRALGEVPGVVLRGQGHAPPDRRDGRGPAARGRADQAPEDRRDRRWGDPGHPPAGPRVRRRVPALRRGGRHLPGEKGNRKGVVEKANDYLTQAWWRTAEVSTPEQAQASLDRFCERVADLRPRGHATVGVLAAAERLRPVPPQPYHAEVQAPRTVSWGALVSFEGNRYSVPPIFVDSQVVVSVRLGEPRLEISAPPGHADLLGADRSQGGARRREPRCKRQDDCERDGWSPAHGPHPPSLLERITPLRPGQTVRQTAALGQPP
jgi:hypothetical protein